MFKQWRQWRFRHRVKRFQQRPDVNGVIALLSSFPSHVAWSYSPYRGSAVSLYVRYPNIELLLQDIGQITAVIENAEYVRFSVKETPTIPTTLDDYLVGVQGGPITPEEALTLLIDYFDALYNEIAIVPPTKQGYYLRKSLPLLEEAVDVIEALWRFVP